MKSSVKCSIVAIIIFGLSGCASYFKRKTCESTNWFTYGENVALEGRRLTGDQFILECQKADSEIDESNLDRGFKSGLEKYCLPDVVFQTGKKGDFFSTEMCVGNNLRKLQELHQEGVMEYCKKSNGYSAGALGKPYNKICPSEKEVAFLPEFNRGRKKYLQAVSNENETRIRQLDQELPRLKRELELRRADLLRVETRRTKETNGTQAASISSEIRALEGKVRQNQSEIDDLRQKNREIHIEIVRLEN